MKIDASELDRYITGNYGEDQFKAPVRVTRCLWCGKELTDSARETCSPECEKRFDASLLADTEKDA